MASETYIRLQDACEILMEELKYPEDRAMHYVKRFDKNHDGRLSSAEFQCFKKKIQDTKKVLIKKFTEFDKDGNGYITLCEASDILQRKPFEFPPGKVIMLLKRFDADGNGKLDIEEFAAFYAEAKATHEDIANRFDQLDKDGNGVLSPDEVAVVIREFMGLDARMSKTMVEMFDTNKDGSLDKTEFMEMWTSMFG